MRSDHRDTCFGRHLHIRLVRLSDLSETGMNPPKHGRDFPKIPTDLHAIVGNTEEVAMKALDEASDH